MERVVGEFAEWSRDGQLCSHSRMCWRQCVVFIPLECEKNRERGRDPEQCYALQRGVGGGGGDVKPMLGLIISLGINKKVLATHLLVSWYEKKVWGYTQECVKEVSMLQHYKVCRQM